MNPQQVGSVILGDLSYLPFDSMHRLLMNTALKLTVVFSLLFRLVWGQSYLVSYTAGGGNPGGLNLEDDDEMMGWSIVLGASAGVNIWSGIQTLPFTVDYFGTGYTDFKVSYHGLLTFSTATALLPPANAALPTADLPDLTLAAFWDEFTNDAPMGNDDEVVSKTFGTAPNRQFWIKWSSVEYGNPAGASDSYFAIVFDEASGDIYLVDMASDNAANSSVTVGLQNSATCAAAYGDQTQALAGNGLGYADNDYYRFTAETLAGTYTVGGVNPDFQTLSNAAAALGCGIGGAVQLDLRDGTYGEQVSFPVIPGSSATDTVLIQSESNDSSAVTITWPPSQGDNYTLYLNGTDYLTLRGLTLQRSGSGSKADARVLWLDSDADYNRITHCRLIGTDTASNEACELIYTSNGDVIDLEISHNRLLNGDEAIFLQTTPTYNSTGVVIQDNVLSDQYWRGLQTQYLVAPTIEGNQISTSATHDDYCAIRLLTGEDAFQIARNQITTPAYGLYLQGNTLVAAGEPQVANNFIRSSGSTHSPLFLINADSVNLYHNTLVGNAFLNGALAVENSEGLTLLNNLLINESFGYALQLGANVATTVLDNADYNDLLTEGGNLCQQASFDYASLCDWQTATGLDGNSISKAPYFQTAGSYDAASPFLMAGTPLPEVSSDLLGSARNGSAPSIGAFEILAPTGPALAGTYAVGTCEDFENFSEAALALATYGVSDEVIFEVNSGTYTEQVRLTGANGASGANPVIFRAQSGDSADVRLTWPASAVAADNYTLQIDGVDHLQFEALTIQRSGIETYGTVVDLAGDADSLTFSAVYLVGGGGSTVEANVMQADGQDVDSLTIENCQISGGGYGLYLAGLSTVDPQQGHRIVNNQFSEHALGGIYLVAQTASTVASNQIALDALGDGILLQSSNGSHQLTANLVELNAGGQAITLDGVVGSVGNESLVANNWIVASGNGVDRRGLGLRGNSDYTQLVHNSVSIQGDNVGNLYAYYTNATGGNHIVQNNIFANTAGSLAIYCANATGLGTANHNDLYNQVGAIGYFNGISCADLAAWQTTTGQDVNSMSVDPLFAGTNDLRVAAVELNDTGTPVAAVNLDYQAEGRDPTNPDIGADEFTPQIFNLTTEVCVSADAIESTGSGQWQYLYANRQLVAAINDNGNNLGTVTAEVYLHSGMVRQAPNSDQYLDRNWTIQISGAVSSGTVTTRLYFLDSELAALIAADPTVTAAGDLGCTRYSGSNQNCDFSDNQAGLSYYAFYPSVDVINAQPYGSDHSAEVEIEDFSEFYLSGSGVVLPVEGLDLRVRQQGEQAQLAWTVARGDNLSHFEVERSIDGLQYETRGSVAVPHASLSDASFRFGDGELPYGETTDLWYRLRVVDLDGSTQHSAAVRLALTPLAATLTLSPNPVRDHCRLHFVGAPDLPAQLMIFDATGRVIYQQKLAPAAEQTLALPVGTWPAGMYWVEVQQGGQRYRERLMR